MGDSDSRIGIDSGITLIFSHFGIGIGIGIKLLRNAGIGIGIGTGIETTPESPIFDQKILILKSQYYTFLISPSQHKRNGIETQIVAINVYF